MLSENCPLGSRAATFRHIFAQSAQRSDWFDWGAGHGSSVIANPKFIAVALEGGAGGQILVGSHENFGKHGRIGLARLQDHTSAVTDIKWNLFNDNVLASGSADCSVKVWHITDGLKAQCVQTLERHSRRVDQIEWHTTVDNVILSAGSDCRILLWDVEVNAIIYEISDFMASCITFSPNSSLFAATSRQSHRVCIFDARTGNAMKTALLPHDGGMSPKVVFASTQRLVTFGNTRINRRQFAIHSLSSFGSPLAIVDVDGSSGQLCPIFDHDLNILYVSGKGDSTFRLYELITTLPHVIHLTECHQPMPHTSVCAVSKRALNLTDAEVMRVYRLHPQSLLVQPISFVVPRRTDHFHPELYPPTRGPTPAASLAEWRAGLDVVPVQLQLRPGQLNTTSKPVQLKGRSGSPKLITSDLNNEMKFRFLCKVTKPDYRSVDEREDFEEIIKLVEVKQKVQEGQFINPKSKLQCDVKEAVTDLPLVVSSSPTKGPRNSNTSRISEESSHIREEQQIAVDVLPPTTEWIEIHTSNNGSSHYASFEKPLQAEKPAVSPLTRDHHISRGCHDEYRESHQNPHLQRLNCASVSRRSPSPMQKLTDEPIGSKSNPLKQSHQLEEVRNGAERCDMYQVRGNSMLSVATCETAPTAMAESLDDLDNESSVFNGNIRDDLSGSGSTRSADEGYRLLENTVTMLEQQLRRSDNRILELERLCDMQQKDMESLRYEISWKDQRIEYLQKTLTELENSLPSSSAKELISSLPYSDPENPEANQAEASLR